MKKKAFQHIFLLLLYIQIAELIPNIGSVTGSDDVHTAYVYMAMDLLSQETCTILNARFKVIMSKVETKTLVKVSLSYILMTYIQSDYELSSKLH